MLDTVWHIVTTRPLGELSATLRHEEVKMDASVGFLLGTLFGLLIATVSSRYPLDRDRLPPDKQEVVW